MKKFEFVPERILLYFRKSRQDSPDQTIDDIIALHRRIADEWISKNLPYQVPAQNIYMERVSGETIKDRHEFQKVLKRLESNDIDAVFVIEPQRLSRGDLEDCGHVINVFRYTDTRIITPHRIYNLEDDGDRMILEMELKSGNQYLEYTKRILKRGKDDAAKRGMWIPSSPPYGYEVVRRGKDRTLAPIKEQADAVNIIFDMYLEGKGYLVISEYLKEHGIKPAKSEIFTKTTLMGILQNPTYIGKIKWNATKTVRSIQDGKQIKIRKKLDYDLYDGIHEPIVSEEKFYQVQEIFGTHNHTKTYTKLRNPLAGIMFCGKCGRSMRISGYSDKSLRYDCPYSVYCHNGSALVKIINEDLSDAINKEIKDKEIIIQGSNKSVIEEWEREKEFIEEKLHGLNDKEEKMWIDRYESKDPIPDRIFQKLRLKIEDDRRQLTDTLSHLEENKPEVKDYSNYVTTLKNALSVFNGDYDAEQKNKILKSCINKIYLTREFNEKKVSYNSYEKFPYTLQIDFKF